MTWPSERQALDILRRLAVSLKAGVLPDPEDIDRLTDAVTVYVEHQGWESFDRCLGLREPSARLRKSQRDSHLRHAWRATSLDPRLSDWERSRRLAAAVTRFSQGDWPRWKGLGTPPPEASDVKRHLFAAFKIDADPPRSAARLHDICRQQ